MAKQTDVLSNGVAKIKSRGTRWEFGDTTWKNGIERGDISVLNEKFEIYY